MANTSAIWQQAAHTTYQLLSPSCSTRAIQKSLTLNEKYLRVFWKKGQENGPLAEKWQDKKSKRTRQKKNKRGDRKGESNDSSEIPDRRATSDIPGLPSGFSWQYRYFNISFWMCLPSKIYQTWAVILSAGIPFFQVPLSSAAGSPSSSGTPVTQSKKN